MKIKTWSLLVALLVFTTSFASGAQEVTAEAKAKSLAAYLTKIATQNGTPAKEKDFTFTQKDLGEISYYLDYYLFTVEDLYRTEREFAKGEVTVSDKNFGDIISLLRDFIDVGKIMRKYEQWENMKCKYLYGAFQDHALSSSTAYELVFKKADVEESSVPTYLGGCWSVSTFPAKYFPSYK